MADSSRVSTHPAPIQKEILLQSTPKAKEKMI
jgi:hypothetical protein